MGSSVAKANRMEQAVSVCNFVLNIDSLELGAHPRTLTGVGYVRQAEKPIERIRDLVGQVPQALTLDFSIDKIHE